MVAVRDGLAGLADPQRAAAMAAYMKSAMPYRGVGAPTLKALMRTVLEEHPVRDRRTWHDTVLALWDEAGFREERYAAITVVTDRASAGFLDVAALDLVEHLIVTGAWWDYVDVLAIRTVGPLVRAHPAELVPVILSWAQDENMWRRRTAIIHQVGTKGSTDTALLTRCLEPSLASKEFFLRKAIGWALRDLAWYDPGWVQGYVHDHGDQLSGLSRREALKNCGPG